MPKKVDDINMHFNKNDLSAKNNRNSNVNISTTSTNISHTNTGKLCYTDADDLETTFDKAKKAFFTPDRNKNNLVTKLNGNNFSSYYPKNRIDVGGILSDSNYNKGIESKFDTKENLNINNMNHMNQNIKPKVNINTAAYMQYKFKGN
jgi:hypothetical protein